MQPLDIAVQGITLDHVDAVRKDFPTCVMSVVTATLLAVLKKDDPFHYEKMVGIEDGKTPRKEW